MNNQYFNNWRGHKIEIVQAGATIQQHGYPVQITDKNTIAFDGKIYMTQNTYNSIAKNMPQCQTPNFNNQGLNIF